MVSISFEGSSSDENPWTRNDGMAEKPLGMHCELLLSLRLISIAAVGCRFSMLFYSPEVLKQGHPEWSQWTIMTFDVRNRWPSDPHYRKKRREREDGDDDDENRVSE